MLLFVHVPKTAGTSFRKALEARFGADRIACDYGRDSDFTSAPVHEHMYAEGQAARPGKLVRTLERDGYAALCGHFPLARYRAHFEPERTIAFLREPLERACSEYLHRNKAGTFRGPFEDFMESGGQANQQARLVKGHEPECFLGVTEYYREALARLNRERQLGLRVQRKNVGERGGGRRLARELEPSVAERFYELNADDLALYRAVRGRFDTPEPGGGLLRFLRRWRGAPR